MGSDATVPKTIEAGVRRICLALPEAYEETAWVGTRWRVRTRTFAHVLHIEGGRPAGYARSVGTDAPVDVLMFRSSGPDLDLLRNVGHPFFGPPWRADEVGLVLEGRVDWRHVAELLTDSYRAQAPKKLASLVDRPPR